MRVSYVQPEQIDDHWPRFEPLIAPALDNEHEELTALDVKDLLENGQMSLLVIIDGAIMIAAQTFEIIEKESYKLMNLVTTCGYRLEEWQDLLDAELTRIAKVLDCKYIHTRGRPGWQRQLKRNGYKPLYFVAEKEVI